MTEHLALEADRSSALADIDALAYVDELAPKDKEAAEALIDQELHTMKAEGVHAEQYVAYMRPAASYCAFESNPILQAEMQRIDRGQRHMPPLDMTATRLETPRLNEQEDVRAWHKSANNAHAQLEHQHSRIVNLKLGIKYGPAAWRAHNARTESLIKAAEKRLRQAEERVTKTNQRRKLKQENAKVDLDRLQNEYAMLVRKNTDIEAACQELEAEIALYDEPAGAAPENGAVADV